MDVISKADEELEEGECSDQDDDGMCNPTVTVPEEPKRYDFGETNTYRQGCIPQIIINSDQSDKEESDYDDDEDSNFSLCAKTRKTSQFSNQNQNVTPSTFINPLRSPEVLQSIAQGSQQHKRRNNVWGSVMTEQMLSQDIKQFGVNTASVQGDRDVESYDFTIAKEDDREEVDIKTDGNEKEDIFGEVVDLEREVRNHQNRKRKRNVKDRLGKKSLEERLGKRNIKDRLGDQSANLSGNLGNLNATANDDALKVTEAITDAMGEQNLVLFTRIVQSIGNEKAIELYNKTVDVENVGGMLILNGHRRRTAGGVYIQLMKNDPSIPPDLISALFEQEQEKWIQRKKEIRQIRKAARQRWKGQNKKLDLDLDRPETPTPPDEFEELDNDQVNDVEVDGQDLPDRPDTPEPKDSSDNESDDEEDDEEDIALAIAKAKAAILKKQSELAQKAAEEEENNQEVEMT